MLRATDDLMAAIEEYIARSHRVVGVAALQRESMAIYENAHVAE